MACKAKIEEAMELASTTIDDDGWLLHRLHIWVAEVVQGIAPDWWTDLDCEGSLPREKRVSTFISTQRKRITFQIYLA
ncbi:MAG: hypothetical protein HWE24_14325 [Oceanospirillaceae bacterium]|nr:hypothetical protein [Oceanospirillaceae bacterium]